MATKLSVDATFPCINAMSVSSLFFGTPQIGKPRVAAGAKDAFTIRPGKAFCVVVTFFL